MESQLRGNWTNINALAKEALSKDEVFVFQPDGLEMPFFRAICQTG